MASHSSEEGDCNSSASSSSFMTMGNTVPDLHHDHRVVDGFERKSVELLDYVNELEGRLEAQRRVFQQTESRLKAEKKGLQSEVEKREAKATSDKKALEEKLTQMTERANKSHMTLMQEERKRLAAEDTIKNLRRDLHISQEALQNERQRIKELENQLCNLKNHIEKMDQLHKQERTKFEEERSKLEEEIKVLKKKATLGWILGCLTEIYLRVEGDNGGEKRLSQLRPKHFGKSSKFDNLEREVEQLINNISNSNEEESYGQTTHMEESLDVGSMNLDVKEKRYNSMFSQMHAMHQTPIKSNNGNEDAHGLTLSGNEGGLANEGSNPRHPQMNATKGGDNPRHSQAVATECGYQRRLPVLPATEASHPRHSQVATTTESGHCRPSSVASMRSVSSSHVDQHHDENMQHVHRPKDIDTVIACIDSLDDVSDTEKRRAARENVIKNLLD